MFLVYILNGPFSLDVAVEMKGGMPLKLNCCVGWGGDLSLTGWNQTLQKQNRLLVDMDWYSLPATLRLCTKRHGFCGCCMRGTGLLNFLPYWVSCSRWLTYYTDRRYSQCPEGTPGGRLLGPAFLHLPYLLTKRAWFARLAKQKLTDCSVSIFQLKTSTDA